MGHIGRLSTVHVACGSCPLTYAFCAAESAVLVLRQVSLLFVFTLSEVYQCGKETASIRSLLSKNSWKTTYRLVVNRTTASFRGGIYWHWLLNAQHCPRDTQKADMLAARQGV